MSPRETAGRRLDAPKPDRSPKVKEGGREKMNKKLGMALLLPLLLISLSSFGAAYWVKEAHVWGEARLGTLSMNIEEISFDGASKDIGVIWYGTGGDPAALYIVLGEWYPGGWVYIDLLLHNDGDIELKLHDLRIEFASGEGALMDWVLFGIPDTVDVGKPPDDVTLDIYHFHYLSWWTTTRYYDDLGIPEIILEPSQRFRIWGFFQLHPDTPIGYMGKTLVIKFIVSYIQYPTPPLYT